MTLLQVPPSWRLQISPRPGVAMVATPGESHLAGCEVALSFDQLGHGDLRRWQRDVDLALPRLLRTYRLIDLELTTVAGSPGVRRLATHSEPEGLSTTIEQWAVIVRERGYTVTTSAPTFTFPDARRELAGIARTLRPPGSAA